jgi:hypothetical protein
MVLQRAQAVSILKCVVEVSEGSSKLGVLSRGPPLSLFDMLLVIRGFWRTWCSLVVCPLWCFFCLLEHRSFHFVPFIPHFLGALIFLCNWHIVEFQFKVSFPKQLETKSCLCDKICYTLRLLLVIMWSLDKSILNCISI